MTTPVPGPKRLTRSSTDSWLGGVCGGLADYLGIDANLLRIITLVLAVVGFGAVIVVYVVAWVIMPKDDTVTPYPPGGPSAPPPPSA